ncbi:MAG TPA: GNAT family N-acetyltransferase [Allosphingosinicella sp.]|jgi:ribosomal-protein-alanine N-acetyltransferase
MNGDRLVLEPGTVADLNAVMGVMEDSFDPAYGEAWTGPQCSGLLPLPGVWLSLARDDGDVVGFALSRAIAGEAELLLLAVKRAAQGYGTGARLLDEFVAAARARRATRLHLEVRDGNPAVALYKRAGFREVGRRRNYYNGRDGQLFDALTLARTVRI